METTFLKLLNMGITGGWVILAVLFLRILLKKAPKAVRCVLWMLVGIRLVCPFSVESALSMVPSAETVPSEIMLEREPAIESGIETVDAVMNPVIASAFAPEPEDSANPLQIVVFLASRIWAAGMAAMLLYALCSCIRLRRRVAAAMRLEKNLWVCDSVKSPFIFGTLFPRVYLPSDLEEPQLSCVIAHEKAHLKRRDHWWKPLGFLLLSVYWFQPLCWVAYILLCRDIELACDEYVVRRMKDEDKKTYANALLFCNMPQRSVPACPLAFGEVGIKERIKGVLYYKKPALWVAGAATVICLAAAVCLLTNPVKTEKQNEIYGARYTVSKVLYDAPWYNATYMPENAPEYIITSEAELLQQNFGGIMGDNPVWSRVGVFHEANYTKDELLGLFASSGDGFADGFGEETRKLLDRVEQVWRVEPEGDGGPVYLVIQSDRDEVLFAVCYGEKGQEHVRWLWSMEQHADQGDTTYLAALISSMSSGTNIQIFAMYESESIPDKLLAGFLDDRNRKCFAVFWRDSASGAEWKIKGFGAIKNDFYGEEQVSGGGDAFGCITIGEEWGFDHSITIAVSSSRNLASVTAIAGEERQSVGSGANSVPDMFIFEWSRPLSEEETAVVELHYYDAAGKEL